MAMHYLALVFRVFWVFIVLLVASRLIGKKFDSLAGFAASVMAGVFVLIPGIALADGVTVLITWSLFTLLFKFMVMKSAGFRGAVAGQPTMLIEQGKIQEKNVRKSNLSIPDMLSMLRQKNAFKLSDVEFAVLEPDGQMSVMKKSELNPLSPLLANIPVVNEQVPHIVIMEGKVMTKTLLDTGYTQGWLLGEIIKQGARDYPDVALAQLDSNGNLYVDLYKDQLKAAELKAKPLLLHSLRKHQADLEAYSLATENPEAGKLYRHLSAKLTALVEEIQPYLR